MQLYHIFSLASSNSNALTLVWIEPYFEKSIKLLRYGISLQLIESLLINLCRTTTMFSPFHSPPRPTMSGLCRYFPFQMSQKTCALYWTYLYLLAGSASCGEMKGTLRCPGGRLRRSLDVRGFRSLGSDLCGQCPEPFLGRVSVPFLLCVQCSIKCQFCWSDEAHVGSPRNEGLLEAGNSKGVLFLGPVV